MTDIWNADFRTVGLARLGGPPTTLPWRYESRGFMGLAAQAPDGTIYALEQLNGTDARGFLVRDLHLVVIDGATGAVRARLPQPRSIFTVTYIQLVGGSTCTDIRSEQGAALSPPVVGLDGTALILVRQLRRDERRVCGASSGRLDTDDRLTLLRVDATGATTEQILFRQQLVDDFNQCAPRSPNPSYLVPDGLGGVLAKFVLTGPCGAVEHKLARVDAAGAQVDRAVTSTMQISMTGDGDTAYLNDQGVLSAVDVTTWAPRWAGSGLAAPIAAVYQGGVFTHDFVTGAMREIDAGGTVVQTFSIPLTNPVCGVPVSRCAGVESSSNALAVYRASHFEEAESSFQAAIGIWPAPAGNPQRQSATRRIKIQGLFAKGHNIFVVNHYGIRIVPTDQQYWRQQEPNVFQYQYRGFWFATLGAGSSLVTSCDGFLKGEFNRERDRNEKPEDLEELLVSFPEDVMIQRLLNAMRNYQRHYENNPLPYSCKPDPPPDNTYNSNGFAGGLLDAVGVPLPSFVGPFLYPGSEKRVPLENFLPVH